MSCDTRVVENDFGSLTQAPFKDPSVFGPRGSTTARQSRTAPSRPPQVGADRDLLDAIRTGHRGLAAVVAGRSARVELGGRHDGAAADDRGFGGDRKPVATRRFAVCRHPERAAAPAGPHFGRPLPT